MIHRLKTFPVFFQPILDGQKTFEIRLNDRNYQIGDVLELVEWCPNRSRFTGRGVRVTVPYLTTWNQHPGNVVMSIANPVPFELPAQPCQGA